ncbi:MAG TPA: M28 family peptidase, partial [Gemmatirosa sp.]
VAAALVAVVFVVGPAASRGAAAQSAGAATTVPAPPALASIRESELRRDLFAMASDSMRGREAGTLDELRAAIWMAERARAAGLRPAGDDGTYFQWWPMRRVRISPERSSVEVASGASPVALQWGRDVVPAAPVEFRGALPLVALAAGDTTTDVRGRAVVVDVRPPRALPPAGVSLRPARYVFAALREQGNALVGRGAAAVVLVGDSTAEAGWEFAGASLLRGRYNVDTTGAAAIPTGAPVLWVRAAAGPGLRRAAAAGGRLTLSLVAESFVYPSANVVAVAPGRDPRLRNEYVVFSGHHDHDGVRTPVDVGGGRLDSIRNGADDNASVDVAILAAGRAFVKAPGRRSALFVWHGAEERGLLGSRWFSAHPTVPRAAMVAVLNGDMIGRNSPDSAALLGVQPPHRNSSDLVAIALAANRQVGHFALDSVWDRPTHPEGWYFRSDHLPYARLGVPAVMFTTLLHPDYHTVRDEPDRIDYAKLTRMARWMYATGWAVAERDRRPAVDPGFKLER